MANCPYCSSEFHHPLCPMAFIESDPNRKQAYDMGVPVSTSDWIDAWAKAGGIQIDGPERESLIALFSLHHRYVATLPPNPWVAGCVEGATHEHSIDSRAQRHDLLNDAAYGHGV